MPARIERIRVAADRMAELSAPMIAKALTHAIAERGLASICLAGGGTPKATYQALAQLTDLEWVRVSVYFGDERCVSPDREQSNYRLAREALLDHVPLRSANIHRIQGEKPDRDAAALEYTHTLPEIFDVLVLGIGEDGHTASLFPGSAALDEKERRVLPVIGPKPPVLRLTLTPLALQGRLTVVLAAGPSKADAVFRALEGPRDLLTCPAQIARDAVWILDHAAAARLTGAWPD